MSELSTETVYYFGYGSLVNRQTRSPTEKIYKATLLGWERQWAHQAEITGLSSGGPERQAARGICPLTIAERSDCRIDGVLAALSRRDLPSLDRRESGYDRLSLAPSNFLIEADIDLSEVYVYRSSESRYGWASKEFPLAQSYVDVVISGYHSLFGADGVERLLASTKGWNLPTMNDRSNPAYGRAIDMDKAELALIDSFLDPVRKNDGDSVNHDK